MVQVPRAINLLDLGSVHKYFGGGAGQNGGGQKSFELPEGGTKKFSVAKGGGSKKFSQIESIMKIKLHNLYFKINRI